MGPEAPTANPFLSGTRRPASIDRKAVAHWKTYDLRRRLEENWPELGPKLKGKLHIWVGEADDYFLNNAVHRLDAFLSHAQPPYGGSITYGPGQGHCWMGISQAAMMKQMAQRTGRASVGREPAFPRERVTQDAWLPANRRSQDAHAACAAAILALALFGPCCD